MSGYYEIWEGCYWPTGCCLCVPIHFIKFIVDFSAVSYLIGLPGWCRCRSRLCSSDPPAFGAWITVSEAQLGLWSLIYFKRSSMYTHESAEEKYRHPPSVLSQPEEAGVLRRFPQASLGWRWAFVHTVTECSHKWINRRLCCTGTLLHQSPTRSIKTFWLHSLWPRSRMSWHTCSQNSLGDDFPIFVWRGGCLNCPTAANLSLTQKTQYRSCCHSAVLSWAGCSGSRHSLRSGGMRACWEWFQTPTVPTCT